MQKKVFLINVVDRRNGYSFAVRCDSSYDEDSVLELILDCGVFNDDEDFGYATAVDITNSPEEIAAFENDDELTEL